MRTNLCLTKKSFFILIVSTILLILLMFITGLRIVLAANDITMSKTVSDSSKSWAPTTFLFTGRHDHTATLLSDGRVMVVGGLQERTPGSPGLASVEIFDPTTSKWKGTGSLNTGRCFHKATLLTNGQVLVTGGRDSKEGTGIASVEIYDPVSETWDFAPSLSTPRFGHSATLLPDGQVLVAGGRFGGESSDVHNSAELYDPQTKTWSSTGSMGTPRESHSATLIPGGRVLVIGGYYLNWLGTSEIYDPVSGTWYENVDPLFCHGVAHTATRLYDDRVLVVGGACSGGISGILSEVEVFDPVTSFWTETAFLPAAREAHTATLLPNGTVLIVGGDNGDNPRYDKALIYNPTNDTWKATGSLNTARRNHTATLLNNGAVLIVGGWSNTTTALDITELFIDSIIVSPTTNDTPIPPTNTISPTITPKNTPVPTAEPFLRQVFSYPWLPAFLILACLFPLLSTIFFVFLITKFSKLKNKDASA